MTINIRPDKNVEREWFALEVYNCRVIHYASSGVIEYYINDTLVAKVAHYFTVFVNKKYDFIDKSAIQDVFNEMFDFKFKITFT